MDGRAGSTLAYASLAWMWGMQFSGRRDEFWVVHYMQRAFRFPKLPTNQFASITNLPCCWLGMRHCQVRLGEDSVAFSRLVVLGSPRGTQTRLSGYAPGPERYLLCNSLGPEHSPRRPRSVGVHVSCTEERLFYPTWPMLDGRRSVLGKSSPPPLLLCPPINSIPT